MSAFMFILQESTLKKMSDQELEDRLVKAENIIKNFDWSKYKQTHFNSDFASAEQANIVLITHEQANRALGTNVPAPKILVPGFNPGDK